MINLRYAALGLGGFWRVPVEANRYVANINLVVGREAKKTWATGRFRNASRR